MRLNAFLGLLLVLGLSLSPGAAVAQTDAYAGSTVSFETNSNAVVDYAVDGETMVEHLQVQSASEAESGGSVDVGAGLSGVTDIGGSALSLESKTSAEARVTTESGATLTAHDNGRGVLVVDAGGDSQYVTAEVAGSGSAEAAGDGRVVVTSAAGTQGTFVVVGDGEATVNEEGDVAARLGSDGKLVFRSYTAGRTEADAAQERLIADGTAAAEVYVEEGSDSSGEVATDVVTYGEDTTVEVTQTGEGTVEMTAERSSEEGRIIIATIADGAVGSADDLQVTVDGEAAARAESYGELESAASGGETSKYMVRQQSSARGSADVLVGVNHFSERQVAVSDGDSGGSDGDGSSDGGSSASPGQPGFGVGIAVVAIAAAAMLARRSD